MDSLQHNPFPESGKDQEQHPAHPRQIQTGAQGMTSDEHVHTFGDTINERFEAQREGIKQHIVLIGEVRETIARLLAILKKSSDES